MGIITDIGTICVAALFGAMVFFPAVVAPTVFKTLAAEEAGLFLRRLFPAYYAFMIVTAGIGTICLIGRPLIAAGLGLVALTTLGVRQWLVPKINGWRDAELQGDTGAAKNFAVGHRASVIVNMAQLAFVGFALITLV
ncbi:MAG: DUF4149 domain-containing protein [Pseudomonadota bacterium]